MAITDRILPQSLQASSSSLMKSLIFDDTEVGYGFSATEKIIPNFSEKLAIIFKYGMFAIINTEKNELCKKHKLIEKILPYREIIGEKLISQKVELFGKFDFKKNEAIHPIQNSYINVFNCMKEIIEEYKIFMQKNPEISDRSHTTPIETKIINSIYNEKTINNNEFRNRVLSRIISLQIKLDEINRMINPIPGVPADPLVRKNRAINAGLLSNHGEQILIEEFISYLINKRPEPNEKFKNISSLYSKHEKEFNSILENYHENIINKKRSSNGHLVKYGATLTSNGLLRKMREWSKTSTKLSEELIYHISPKKKIN